MSILQGSNPQAVEQAAQHLAAGALVAFATETVYGLGARADDDVAVARIFAAKGRPAEHPLIVHVHSAAQVLEFAQHISPAAQCLMAAFWPGPLTLILPRRANKGRAAAGGQDSIGLRVPSHPVALALLVQAARFGVPGVAAPSANRFGRISPTTAAHVVQELGDGLLVLDGGACDVGIESAIVDCTRAQPALLRPGQLGRDVLEAVLLATLGVGAGAGVDLTAGAGAGTRARLRAPDASAPRVSGSLASHYAPSAPVALFDSVALRHRLLALRAGPALVVGVYSRLMSQADLAGSAHAKLVFRPMPNDAAAVAHELFAVLRELDDAGVSAIWVEQPPPGPAWDGVRDRLQRAAA
jgi:L-threonylcarbamoyladenylate synthase